jgi:hypothetical protein
MNNVYLIERHDMTPNAMRAGVQPTYYLQRNRPMTSPGRVAIDDGWLGTYNDIYSAAHGCFDLDSAEEIEALRDALKRLAITTPMTRIRAWENMQESRTFSLKVRDEPAHVDA